MLTVPVPASEPRRLKSSGAVALSAVFRWLGRRAVLLFFLALGLANLGPLAPERGQAAEAPLSLSWSLARLPASEAPAAFAAVLWLEPAPGWHAYSHTPGETGRPLEARLGLEPGGPVPVYYPEGLRKPDVFEPEKTAVTYEGRTPLFIPLPGETPDGAVLSGRLDAFLCSDASCWPMSLTPRLVLDQTALKEAAPADAEPWWPQYLEAKALAQTAAPGKTVPESGPAPAAGPADQTESATSRFRQKLAEKPTEAATALSAAPDAIETPGPSPAAAPAWSELFTPRFASPELEAQGLFKAGLLALLAGFILNFMPCVLPVISLKLAGLLAAGAAVETAARRGLLRRHNLFFALGILAYFAGLSLLLGFAGLAWGEIFQRPGLVMAVTAVLFALSLSLFGVFHLPVIDLKAPVGERQETGRGAFVSGLLATLLATPCSGPFLGGVLAWTLLQPVAVITAVFLCIGLGMAAPYLVFALWPQAVRFMPRPGPYMRKVEILMGFVLAGTCLYFLAILPRDMLLAAVGALWATAFAAWIWGGWTSLSQSAVNRWSLRALALALAVAASVFAARERPPDEPVWRDYRPEVLAALLGRENLLVDFTADWCPTCKFLEKTVLTEENLRRWTEEYELTLIRVDLTARDPEAMGLLRALGSQSIPLAALFSKKDGGRSPLALRDLFTASRLEQAMDATFGE